MSEQLSDDRETQERALLWSDITEIFQSHAFAVGIQQPFTKPHFRLALVAQPDVNFIMQLWGKWTNGVGLEEATLLYRNKAAAEQGRFIEDFNYTIRGTDIAQYSPQPTLLDYEDVCAMRRELRDAQWDANASADAAENQPFWEV